MTRISAAPMPRVVTAGVPRRTPLATIGGLVSNGMAFLFTVMAARPSAASATVLGRTDNGRNTWRMKGTSITYGAWQENLPSGTPATGQAETEASQ